MKPAIGDGAKQEQCFIGSNYGPTSSGEIPDKDNLRIYSNAQADEHDLTGFVHVDSVQKLVSINKSERSVVFQSDGLSSVLKKLKGRDYSDGKQFTFFLDINKTGLVFFLDPNPSKVPYPLIKLNGSEFLQLKGKRVYPTVNLTKELSGQSVIKRSLMVLPTQQLQFDMQQPTNKYVSDVNSSPVKSIETLIESFIEFDKTYEKAKKAQIECSYDEVGKDVQTQLDLLIKTLFIKANKPGNEPHIIFTDKIPQKKAEQIKNFLGPCISLISQVKLSTNASSDPGENVRDLFLDLEKSIPASLREPLSAFNKTNLEQLIEFIKAQPIQNSNPVQRKNAAELSKKFTHSIDDGSVPSGVYQIKLLSPPAKPTVLVEIEVP